MENILYFDTQAEHFEEAIPIGNGHTGAMVYGKTDIEKISFNHDTLWSGGSGDRPVPEKAPELLKKIQELVLEKKYMDARVLSREFTSYDTASYLPFGNLFIHFNNEEIDNYSRTLDLENGIAYTDYNVNGYKHHREVFASFNQSLIAIKIETENKSSFSFEFEHKLKITNSDGQGNFEGICPYYVVNFLTDTTGYEYINEDSVVSFTHKIKCSTNGKMTINNNKFYIEDADNTVIYVSIDTNYSKPTREYLEYNTLKDEHIKDFSSLYNRTTLEISTDSSSVSLDKRIKDFNGEDLGLYELLFNFGRYLIISSSRTGSEATNLQGLWNEELIAPWRSNYTLNINTEMNYWPVHMSNLSECFDPFINLMNKMRQNGRATAKDYYNANGFVCHHNTDFWGHTNPVGKTNGGSYIFSFWNMSSGWMANQLYDEYEYTLDKDKLKNTIYPIMKESAQFYLDIMYKDENGKLMICPSTSPENTFLVDGEGCAAAKTTMMSASILYDLFTKLNKANEILGIDENYDHIIDNLYFPEILADGRLPEWSDDLPEMDSQHRHVSHLYGLHPADFITPDKTPKLADACVKSLNIRGDVGTGWSLAWKVNLWARLKDGNRALKILERQLKYVDPSAEIDYVNGGGTYPNLFDAHPPFQIDGNFGTLSGIIELLLFSRTGYIEILPALPDKFKNGYVKGLKAKGNITVDIQWENNKAVCVTLLSPFSQTVSLKINNMEKITSLYANKKLVINIDN